MATITLMDGDFGSGVTASVTEVELFLPNPVRPGAREVVPLTAVAEIESVSDDHSGQLKHAVALGLRGASVAGPMGLLAGALAVRKVKDVNFKVVLKDGRKLIANADAITYADLNAAFVYGRRAGERVAEADPADEIIAKYLQELRPAAPPAASAPPAPPAAATGEAASPSKGPQPKPTGGRPTFGKRRPGPG